MKYNDDSIKVMSPLEGIRKRLGMYISGNDNDAVHHVVKELVSNSIDEFINGYGKIIEVEVNEDENWIRVRDYGRGIPHGKLDDVFTKTHSSGKIKGENTGAYAASGGLNGIGAKVAVATGNLEASSYRNKIVASNWYHYQKKGELKISQTTKKNGTEVRWKPDNNVFTDNQIKSNKVEELLVMLAYISTGLTFKLKNGEEKTISKQGIETYLTDHLSIEEMISPIIKFKTGDSFLSIEGAMVWTKGRSVESSFVNFIPTSDGGTHISSLKTVLTREFNKIFNSDLKGDELRRGWSYIISVKTSEEPMFKSQQKSALNMPELNSVFSKTYKEEVERILNEHKDFFQKLQETVEKERKKEAAVAQVRNTLAKTKSKTNPIPDKLKPCLGDRGELFITEGISASGSLISQRDVYKSAIMSLKGKPINTRKHDISKVLKNTEIQDLIIALGGFGDDFNIGRMKYDKIFILADADPDGSHIDLLLINFFFQFYPEIIRQGKLYSIKTPLYIITDKKGKREYIFTHEEMDKKRKQIPQTSNVSYAKGLGELEPEILGELAFGKNRKLIQFQAEDEEALESLLDKFMGEDAAERREYVNS